MQRLHRCKLLSLSTNEGQEDIRDPSLSSVHTCHLPFQAEDGIRDTSVTGVQTCALPIQAEDGIRDTSVTGVQTCALPIWYPPVVRLARLTCGEPSCVR